MKWFLFSILALCSSCSNWYATSRSDYRLVEHDGFLLSNIYVHPTNIDVTKDHIAFNYIVVVKNTKETTRHLNLADASITIGLRQIPVSCHSHKNKNQTLSLAPGETISVVCPIVLNKKEGMFQVGDYKSLIEIPLEKTPAQFTYLLRAEDFQ